MSYTHAPFNAEKDAQIRNAQARRERLVAARAEAEPVIIAHVPQSDNEGRYDWAVLTEFDSVRASDNSHFTLGHGTVSDSEAPTTPKA